MRMIFRRQNHSSTKCPSCGFMNPGLQSDEVQWRIEEIQDIRISSDSSNAQTDLVEVSAARFQRPRPPKPQNPEDDICRYKQVQLVDVDFKIGLSTVDQLVMKTALKLNLGDLSDIEYLAERLALAYGLSEADSLALSQKIDVQHAHIRSLQRHLLDSDSNSGSKSKQTAEVDQPYDNASIVGQPQFSPDAQQSAVLYTPTTLREVGQGFDVSYASEVADFVLFPTTVDQRFQSLFTEMPSANFDFSETTQPDIFQPIGWSDVDI
ncbi:Zinc finger transcription factor ace1 [Trichoderma lentiforme]|uniref:Zinc finger transcription factor ace1 n=1 Tax=Trichoderma lentiforme TaxID=1567552 RepID=A0A9P5C8S7_9HYPO|nr:Zinc finger transcription factor ace1 [Trichoderma lentiforme]